jgi:hypothetical protein
MRSPCPYHQVEADLAEATGDDNRDVDRPPGPTWSMLAHRHGARATAEHAK